LPNNLPELLQFIKSASGQEVVIGHNLKACTQDLQVFAMDHPDGSGRRLVLVDTQGFDDDLIGISYSSFYSIC